MLTNPLRDRFGIVSRLEFYTDDELCTIVSRSAGLLDVQTDPAGAAEIARRSREDETVRRLATVAGIRPLITTAMSAHTQSPEVFRKGRDFAAWLGLTPRPLVDR